MLPLLLFAGMASAVPMFRCEMDGLARAKCCCPAPSPLDVGAHASLERAPCCTEESFAVSSEAPAPRPDIATFTPIAPASFVVAPAVTPRPALVESAPLAFFDDVATGATGPPLYLLHRSLRC
jgi:hypothetical protein